MGGVVLVGSGSSVKREDLALIQGFDAISFNRSYLIFEDWGFNPTYFASFDPRAIKVISGDLRDRVLPHVKRKVFLNASERLAFPVYERLHFVEVSSEIAPQFSLESISDCYTVGASAVQVLGALGYKKILLLGVDANYTMTGSDYFLKDYSLLNRQNVDFNVEDMFKGWERIATLCKTEKVEVVNCSRISNLGCFARLPLEEGVEWLKA
jgi:hypothetical protein